MQDQEKRQLFEHLKPVQKYVDTNKGRATNPKDFFLPPKKDH